MPVRGRHDAVLGAVEARLGEGARADAPVVVADCLAGALDADYALVAEARAGEGARVLAFSARDGRRFLHRTFLGGSAAASALAGAAARPAGLSAALLADLGLRELGAKSALARVLRDSGGVPIGLVAVLDRSPRSWDDEAGSLLAVLAFASELELRRRRSLERLSRVAREWTATIDSLPYLVAVVAPDHRLRRVNRAFARAAGAHPRELVGRTCHEVLHGCARPWPGCPHEQAMRTGRSATLRVEDPAFGPPSVVTCTPLFADGGRLAGTVHVAHEIRDPEPAAAPGGAGGAELEARPARVGALGRTLPICAVCKRIRDEADRWEPVDSYLRDRAGASFTHTFCPQCARELYPECFPG